MKLNGILHPSARGRGAAIMWYTIVYVDQRDNAAVTMPVLLASKEAALENACALLKAGFLVSSVSGPDFEMRRTELTAYAKSQQSIRTSASDRARVGQSEAMLVR